MRRFDVLRDESDETHVVLSEVYVDQAAADAHKQTAHYARWQDAVAEMMAETRTRAQVHVGVPRRGRLVTRFDLALPRRVLFGPGRSAELPGLLPPLGRRVLLCTGRDPTRHGHLLGDADPVAVVPVPHEPTVDDVRAATDRRGPRAPTSSSPSAAAA